MFPTRLLDAHTPPWDDEIVVLEHPTAGGDIARAWLWPHRAAAADRPAPLVCFLHGNAEQIDSQRPIAAAYRALGYSVLLPEYRGYGHSDGRPSQRNIVSDVVAFLKRTSDRDDVDATRIVLHGRSIGGALAAQVAAEHRPAAIIVESTITHAGAFAWRYGVPPFLVKNPLRTKDVLPTINVPTLIFHGERDRIVPVSHGRHLHELTPNSRLVTFDAGHNDFPGWGNEEDYWRAIATFLRAEDE